MHWTLTFDVWKAKRDSQYQRQSPKIQAQPKRLSEFERISNEN
jgi:hypothetical protein